MFCYLSNLNGFKCIGADGPECKVFYPEGVRIRNKRGTCNFKDMRSPNTKITAGRKVNPLKQSKRGK